jgi:hypothetical protein
LAGPAFVKRSLLALVPVGLDALPVLVLRHLLSTLLYERSHAKTFQKGGDSCNGRGNLSLGQTENGIGGKGLRNATPGNRVSKLAAALSTDASRHRPGYR